MVIQARRDTMRKDETAYGGGKRDARKRSSDEHKLPPDEQRAYRIDSVGDDAKPRDWKGVLDPMPVDAKNPKTIRPREMKGQRRR
jgi:hypothetical protein